MTLASVLWASVLCATVTSHAPLHVRGQTFRDTGDREVILRGMNFPADAKVPPFRTVKSEADLETLTILGVNAIRLLFIWEAYEPQPGVYDPSYIAYYAQVARWAWDRGIYTVVDFHQDALSRVLIGGCGEGFPSWVIPSTLTHHTPDNREHCSKWFLTMWLDHDLWRAWDMVYNPNEGIRQAYIQMVGHAAHDLQDVPGIVGYDMLNEPRGDEVTKLAPFYEDAGAAIRQADPNAILFVEPHLRVDVGLGSALPKPSFGNIVYAPHFYDPATTMLDAYLGYSLRSPLAGMQAKAKGWDVPLFVGEFGCPALTRNALGYVRGVYDLLDEYHASGAQWSYTPGWTEAHKDGWNQEDLSIIDDHGRVRPNFEPRPYAQKVAGDLITMHVQRDDRAPPALILTWDNRQPENTTEIYLPPHQGPWSVQSDGTVQCAQQSAMIMTCSAREPGRKQVTISARP